MDCSLGEEEGHPLVPSDPCADGITVKEELKTEEGAVAETGHRPS